MQSINYTIDYILLKIIVNISNPNGKIIQMLTARRIPHPEKNPTVYVCILIKCKTE